MPGAQDIRAGKAFVEAYLDKTKLAKGLASVSRDLQAFGAGIASLGKKLMVLGAGIVAPLLIATKRFAHAGDQLDKMSARTGVSTNALSELGFAAQQSGSDIETVEKSIRLMQKSISGATDGPLKRLQGMAPEDQFMVIADSLNAIEDPTKRAAMALDVFGRGGTSMLPMVRNVRALREEARELGLSMSPERAKQAAALTDAMNRVRRSFGAVASAIGGALAPMLTGLANKAIEYVGIVRQWLSEHKPLIVTIFAAGTAAVAAGVGLFVFGKAVALAGALLGATLTIAKGVAFGFAALQHAVLLLANPWVLLGAAILAVGGYLLYTTGALKNAAAWIGQTVGDLVSEVTSSLGIIADSMAAGDFASAAKVGWALVKLEWQKGVAFITTLWEEFKGVYDTIVTGLAIGMVNAAATIQKAFAETMGFLSRQAITFMTSGPGRMLMTLGMSEKEKKWVNVALDLMAAGAGGMDKVTEAQIKAIEDARQAQLAGLGGGLLGRGAGRVARIQAAQDAVDAARAEWQAAKQDAAAKAAAKAGEPGGLPGVPGVDWGTVKGTVRGTFAASAVAGLAVGIQQKIAQNTLAMKEQLVAIRRETERLSLEAEP